MKTTRTPYEMVKEFHTTYNIDVDTEITNDLRDLRYNLISEEADEVFDELYGPIIHNDMYHEDIFTSNIDKKKLTKELADLMYVTIGAAVTFGLPLEEVFNEVHKSNMSKLGLDGKPIYRDDGKVLKGPNYKEPDLEKYFNS